MLKFNRKIISLIFLDLATLFLSYAFSILIAFAWNFKAIQAYLQVFAVLLIIKLLFFMYFNLYTLLLRYASTPELLNLIKAILLSTVFSFAFIYSQPFITVDVRVLIIDSLFTVIFIGGIRLSFRMYMEILRLQNGKPVNAKKVLLIGAGQAAAMLIKQDNAIKEIEIIGCLDDDERKVGQLINGVPVIGKISDLDTILSSELDNIDEVVLAIPSASGKRIREIINQCKTTSIPFRIVPGINEIMDDNITVNQIRDVNIEDLLRRDQIDMNLKEITSYISNKCILITGAGGSIGSELSRQVSKFNPKQLLLLGHGENSIYHIENELKKSHPFLNVKSIICDVRERKKIHKLFALYQPDVVFHAAAHKHVPLMEENPDEAIRNNIFGTLNVADAADLYMCEKFVMISTDKANNPTNIMGACKRIAEMVIQHKNKISETQFVTVRFGNVLGSRGSVIPLFKKQIENGGPITVTHPEVTRFFMTIPEAVQLVLQAGSMAHGGEIYVLDMGEPVKISDLAKDLIHLSGLTLGIDIDIEYIGMRPGEKMYEELFSANEELITTTNTKIMVAKHEKLPYKDLVERVQKLLQIALTNPLNIEQLKAEIKKVLPNYNA